MRAQVLDRAALLRPELLPANGSFRRIGILRQPQAAPPLQKTA
jgi:hypothetical protein